MNRFFMVSPARDWKEGDLPMDPFVQLGLGTFTSDGKDVFVTPHLMTDSEIDYEVDRLKAELEEFRRRAKSELPRMRKKILDGVSKRIAERG